MLPSWAITLLIVIGGTSVLILVAIWCAITRGGRPTLRWLPQLLGPANPSAPPHQGGLVYHQQSAPAHQSVLEDSASEDSELAPTRRVCYILLVKAHPMTSNSALGLGLRRREAERLFVRMHRETTSGLRDPSRLSTRLRSAGIGFETLRRGFRRGKEITGWKLLFVFADGDQEQDGCVFAVGD
jgi:hypothetical protein